MDPFCTGDWVWAVGGAVTRKPICPTPYPPLPWPPCREGSSGWGCPTGRVKGGGGGAGHKSAPHMHVLVCICSNVQQFFKQIIMMYRSVPPMLCNNLLACFFVNTCVFALYSTSWAPKASPSALLTVLVLALLGQVS